MRQFLKDYSYDSVKLFVTQFAIAIFGFVLTLATGLAENKPLQIGCSIFAVLFYLFLLYTTMWDMGSKISVSISYGRIPYKPHIGLLVSLLSNSLNYLLALFVLLGRLWNGIGFFHALGSFATPVIVFIEGMYSGILTLRINDVPLNSMVLTWFLTPIPALLTCWVAYIAGVKNFKFTKLFSVKAPNSDTKNK